MNFSRGDETGNRLGLELEHRILDLTAATADGRLRFGSVSCLEDVLHMDGGLASLEKELDGIDPAGFSEYLIPSDQARPRATIQNPQKIIGIGLNYHDHADEVDMAKPEAPLLFAMFANTIIGPDEDILIPEMSNQLDYEAEMGIVIGKRGRHIAAEDALDFVAGYTIVNDVSARDLQFSDNQWVRGKSFDTFAPIGPVMTTRSALGDGSNLAIELRLNGKTMQKSHTGNLIFKVPELVSYTSRILMLQPGDVISTGTPGGVGFSRKPPIFLKPGDVIEIDLEGVGTLRNTVANE